MKYVKDLEFIIMREDEYDLFSKMYYTRKQNDVNFNENLIEMLGGDMRNKLHLVLSIKQVQMPAENERELRKKVSVKKKKVDMGLE
jgi:hypothetical protein